VLFARRNWKLGRIDRKGALRVAGLRFLLALLTWVGFVHAVPDDAMFSLTQHAVASWLLSGAVIWILYLALEPSVRARWPHSIVTWNRILAGRWLDAQVGSHVLIGAAVGCVLWQLFVLPDILLGHNDKLSGTGGLAFVQGTRQWVGGHAGRLADGLTVGLGFFFALFFLRTLLKRDWLAAVVASLLGIWIEGAVVYSTNWKLTAAIYFVVYFALFLVMLRFGLVATISCIFFVNSFNSLVLGFDWSTWYAPYGLATLLMMLTIAFGSFWRSLGSRNIFSADAAEAA
ncbi:MAG TPA: hypothetical protein VGH38_12620, partial [Bryobacteraceae bacterium]